jgi:NADPH:quinone reductase-like Zn-dependent oxidoreductase
MARRSDCGIVRGMKTSRIPAASLLIAALALLGARDVFAQALQKQYRLVREGDALQLKLMDAPVVQPGPNQVLVRVRATSLNRRDVMIAKGQYRVTERASLVPLSDGAGEVVAIGAAVTRFKVGDRVAATFFQKWISGQPDEAMLGSALGGEVDGMLSQHVTLEEQGLVKLPAGYSFEEGATLPCAAVTAWNGLARGGLQAGDWVLLQGTGGVSIFGLQLAVASGAKAIITSSSDAKLERAKTLGATGTINYRKQPDWEQPVREISGGGVRHVLEVGGKETLPKSLASIAQGGHLALIGGLTGFVTALPAADVTARGARATGIYVGSRADFEAMNAFIELHRIKPVIDRVFDFKDAQAAFDYMDSGSHFGKVVIRL